MGSKSSPETPTHNEMHPLSQRLAESVANYLSLHANDVLRPHQLDVFIDLWQFLSDGKRLGSINLPTGTGKTVLFVEFAKALQMIPDGMKKPSILVVTPTTDLVLQTAGRSGEKGFGGFAADLDVRTYFGSAPQEDKEYFTRADVGITTYNSFISLGEKPDFVPVHKFDAESLASHYHELIRLYQSDEYEKLLAKEDASRHGGTRPRYIKTSFNDNQNDNARWQHAFELAEKRAQRAMERYRGAFVGEPILDQFDVIILDEAHHALSGTRASEIIKSLSTDTVVIGFTATPDASKDRKLATVLPETIHSMELPEAVNLGLLSPIVPIAIQSGLRIDGYGIYSETGDYIDERIGYVARDANRNEIILKTAEVFAGQGIGTIISCIAGGEAAHARLLADELNARGIKAKAVYAGIPTHERVEIYKQFEDGVIDTMTFIGVLGEGFDSQRAKAIINARPTRSTIFATQRPGRVARLGDVAYVVDIIDTAKANPPISIADVLQEDAVPFGTAIGVIPSSATQRTNDVLALLRSTVPIMDSVKADYSASQEVISTLPISFMGRLLSESGKEFAFPSSINGNYSKVTEDIIVRAAELQGVQLDTLLAQNHGLMRTAYDRSTSSELLRNLLLIDRLDKFHIYKNNKWASTEGLSILFGSIYPGITARVIAQAIENIEDSLDWIPARTVTSKPRAEYTTYRVLKLYRCDAKDTQKTLNDAIATYYAEHKL